MTTGHQQSTAPPGGRSGQPSASHSAAIAGYIIWGYHTQASSPHRQTEPWPAHVWVRSTR